MITRIVLTLCGLAAGVYCIPAAFWNGVAMAEGSNGYILGFALAAIVVGSWLLGPIALERFRSGAIGAGIVLTLAWVVTFGLVLANSVGFVATSRGQAVSSRVVAIERYERADADMKRFNTELQAAKSSPRWAITSGCTSNIVADASKAYCRDVAKLQKGIQEAEGTLKLGRPGTGDAQAEMLSWVTGMKIETISKALPLWTPIIMELAANGFFFAAALCGTTRAPNRKSDRRSRPRRNAVVKLVPSRRRHGLYVVEGSEPDQATTTEQMAAISQRIARLR